MANSSLDFGQLPPLPTYSVTARPPVVSFIPDTILTLILPIIAYWVVSMFFHWIDVNDYFSQYRLHTPAEVLKRNLVTRWDVVRDVILQQIIQTAVGLAISYWEPAEFTGKEDYDVAVWATRIRVAQMAIPRIMLLAGIDSIGLAKKVSSSYPMLAGALNGGQYPFLTQTIIGEAGESTIAPAFAGWELAVAGLIYWYLIPVLQFTWGILFIDTWQYFLHRAMHMNKWLYTKFHSRHHRLYVPYAFGALYNHPFEGFLLDTAGTGIAFITSGMTARQGMWFFTCSTIKTVDDHCGYAFPWDPIQHITSNNAAYHDIHHQSWGIKTNFSQPFFTFWDRFLDTRWTGDDISARYERSRLAAQEKVDRDNADKEGHDSLPDSTIQDFPIDDSESDDAAICPNEEDDSGTRNLFPRSVRRKTSTFSPQADGLKGLSHRVTGSIRQK